MKTNFALVLGAFAVMVVAAPRPAHADGNPILGPAFSYNLIGVPLTATGGPAPINPGVLVGLNPQPLPPLPDPGANVSLINPSDPLYTYPGVAGAVQTFQVEWGMNAGGPVSFTPPTPGPNDPLQQTFNGIAPGGEIYAVTFNLGGADPGSFVSLNPQPLPPFPAPGFGFQMFTFTAGAGDPTLSFTVSSDGTGFGFSPTPAPEPSSLLLLGSGLAGLCGLLRRKLLA